MILKLYSDISNKILRWRYRRLYYRLFWHYAQRYNTAEEAALHAAEAFQWLTCYPWADWADLFLPKMKAEAERNGM